MLQRFFKVGLRTGQKKQKQSKKDSANQFHTVYKIAGELFTKGGELDANVVSALYNDCKQKSHNV